MSLPWTALEAGHSPVMSSQPNLKRILTTHSTPSLHAHFHRPRVSQLNINTHFSNIWHFLAPGKQELGL